MNQRPLRTLVPMLALVAAAVPLLAQTATEAPVLRVQGSAEIRVVPDLAVVRLGVANEAPTAQDANHGRQLGPWHHGLGPAEPGRARIRLVGATGTVKYRVLSMGGHHGPSDCDFPEQA